MDIKVKLDNPYNVSSTPKTNPVKSDENKSSVEKNYTQSDKNLKDRYIPSEKEANNTYQKPAKKVDAATLDQLIAESKKAAKQLEDMVRRLLGDQVKGFKDYGFIEKDDNYYNNEISEAQKAIGDGGYLSPDSVSDRIVDFAIAISNGDKNKLETLKVAINKGFDAAARQLGGSLPEISNKTYDLIMDKLDKWSKEEV